MNLQLSTDDKFKDLCFFINWFDDVSILGCLDSLPVESHKMVVDGKYRDFEAPNELSHPLLRKEVLSYSNVEIIDAPNLTEVEKRNVYLLTCKQKYGFMIDADEYIYHIDWDMFFEGIKPLRTDLRAVWIKHHTDEGRHDIMPRIIIHPNEWELYGAHWLYRKKDTGYIPKILDDKVWLDVNILELGHDHLYRTPDWTDRRDKYSKILIKQEDWVVKKYITNDLR